MAKERDFWIELGLIGAVIVGGGIYVATREKPVPIDQSKQPQGVEQLEIGATHVTFVTSLGPLEIELEPDVAPKHVKQFLRLVRAGIFESSKVIRIEKNFVVQFGGTYERDEPLTDVQKPIVEAIPAEFSDKKHVRRTVSMARDANPDSATTSFSILLGPAPHLDGQYTIFGHLQPESEPTLQAIEAVPVVEGTTKPSTKISVIEALVR